MVMILAGILAAFAATRFYVRTGFDVATFAETIRTMARYAQKLAIAQNRVVWVTGTVDAAGNVQGVGLCYVNSTNCPAAQQVAASSGSNSGSPNTRLICTVGNVYAPTWYCESAPSAGIAMKLASGSFSPFFFNGLGKPYMPNDVAGQASTFTTTQYNFSGDGVSVPVTVYQETGYVN